MESASETSYDFNRYHIQLKTKMKFAIVLVVLAVVAGIGCQYVVAPGFGYHFGVGGQALFQGPAYPTAWASVPAFVAGEARYVAKTRGSEHSAPLPGHMESAASFNTDPAPGTF